MRVTSTTRWTSIPTPRIRASQASHIPQSRFRRISGLTPIPMLAGGFLRRTSMDSSTAARHREDLDCVDNSTPTASPPMARCGYRQMLAHGYQLAPWRGSDNHLNPGAKWDNFALGARGICLADAITKPAFRQALRAQRCYWALNGSPRVELEIEGVPMGEFATTDATLDYAIFVDGNGTEVGGGWEIYCGEVTQDGGNGGFTFVASGPCAGGSCEVSGSVPAEFWDWCYARVRRSDTFPVVVTAAVYLPEPSQHLQLGSGIALLSVLGWRRRRRSRMPSDNRAPVSQ